MFFSNLLMTNLSGIFPQIVAIGAKLAKSAGTLNVFHKKCFFWFIIHQHDGHDGHHQHEDPDHHPKIIMTMMIIKIIIIVIMIIMRIQIIMIIIARVVSLQ